MISDPPSLMPSDQLREITDLEVNRLLRAKADGASGAVAATTKYGSD